RLIRSNQALVTEFVEKYFNQALTAFLDSQRTFEQSMRQAMGLGGGTVADWARQVFTPRPVWPAAESPQPASSAIPKAPSDNTAELKLVVEDLKREVEALKASKGKKSRK